MRTLLFPLAAFLVLAYAALNFGAALVLGVLALLDPLGALGVVRSVLAGALPMLTLLALLLLAEGLAGMGESANPAPVPLALAGL